MHNISGMLLFGIHTPNLRSVTILVAAFLKIQIDQVTTGTMVEKGTSNTPSPQANTDDADLGLC